MMVHLPVMKKFTVDCRSIGSFGDFVEAMNQGLISRVGGEWNGHLDAFNDYLSWPEGEAYELELLGAAHCAITLGHDAKAAWLRYILSTCHPSNEESVRSRLARAERGQGETLYDVICMIIRDNSHIRFLEA